jgi:hypothetical protein
MYGKHTRWCLGRRFLTFLIVSHSPKLYHRNFPFCHKNLYAFITLNVVVLCADSLFFL